MKKLRNKIIFDCIMLVLFVLLQLKHITSESVHENLGAAFVIFVICHLIINSGWVKNMFKVKKNARFWINVILFISFAVVVVSGVMVSANVFRVLNIEYNDRWFRIHAWSSRIMIAAVVAHILNHSKMIVAAFGKKKSNKKEIDI